MTEKILAVQQMQDYTEENIVDIINVMSVVKSDNLRAVMFECQKTSDIIKVFDGELRQGTRTG